MTANILIVDDQESIRHFIARALSDEGHNVGTAGEGREALKLVEKEPPDLVLLDLRLPDMHGLDVLKEIKSSCPELPVVIMTAFGDVESAVRAMKLGAFDYINKPLNLEQLSLLVGRGLDSQKLWRELTHHRRQQSQRFSGDFVRGSSPKIHAVFQMCEQVALSDSTSVLIQGESGTGKELVANMIHELSARKDKPFLEINCAAIPREILESELFGHEKGAFTDARQQKLGLLEMANGGTLFLDEVGEMTLNIQVKLLRVLERMTFRRVGGTKDIKVSVRIVSATNQDLQKMVKESAFREDLYYRLKVVPIFVPPLRERREDIPALVGHFVRELKAAGGGAGKRFEPAAISALQARPWPGNVRELRNAVERLLILTHGKSVTGDDVARLLGDGGVIDSLSDADLDVDISEGRYQAFRDASDRRYLQAKLQEHNFNVTETAKALGLPRSNLYKKVTRLNLTTKEP